ncbi:MAG: gamma-glutamyltransferase, partial [Bacteroidota bacterium]
VVYPRAGNIGGGGFMVFRDNEGENFALDYREKAPAAASRDMYLDENGDPVSGLSTRGHLAAGVPGTVAGMVAAHSRFGQLPWVDLIQPAIDLANNGYHVSAAEVNGRLIKYQDDFREFNESENMPFIKDNWQVGDLIVQKDLAASLTRIRDEGHDGFYSGKTAELIVAEMQSGNGLISLQDLKNYVATWRTPIIGDYKDYHIISMPPSSSGGIALVQMLKMVEPYPLADYGFQSLQSTHLMVEAERRAYADRAEYLGDSDYYPVPMDSLLDEGYLLQRMEDFRPDSASSSELTGAGDFTVVKELFETTHTSIIDAEGNAVSVTTTLNGNFGCKVMVDGGGFFLNNEMDDFSAKPGVPNMFGLVGKEANAIAPGKRMLSSMTPTIVEKDGKVFMVLGAPGGSTIITAVYQVFLNVVEFGMPLNEAVAAPRFHHQFLPDEIWVEPTALSPAVRDSLAARGHSFRERKAMAKIKAIHRLPDGSLHAVGDPRNLDDDVSGY